MIIINTLNLSEQSYFQFLSERINYGLSSRYSKLLDLLFHKEFIFPIQRDRNRATDGLDLRNSYFGYCNVELGYPNVLEVLVALALRLDLDVIGDDDEKHLGDWFWGMLFNLGLSKYDDDNFKKKEIDKAVDIWLRRGFDYDGKGSIFPLKTPQTDQRTTEIWYQANAYIIENVKI